MRAYILNHALWRVTAIPHGTSLVESKLPATHTYMQACEIQCPRLAESSFVELHPSRSPPPLYYRNDARGDCSISLQFGSMLRAAIRRGPYYRCNQRFKRKSSAQRPACGAKRETPQHFLLDCLAFRKWQEGQKPGRGFLFRQAWPKSSKEPLEGADLTKDIKILMDSLEQNNVYKEVLGRTLGDGESPAPDLIDEGYSVLTWGCKAIQPLVGTALPTQPQETPPEFPQSEDDGLAHNDPEDPDNGKLELELDEEMEQSLNDTQPVLSLQTADDIDLEMDADLQERVEALDEGDGSDNSNDDGDKSDFFC
ncbi:hypothetical protein EDB92DRAFT_1820656 [Lactarius akahatsu]|uniref:Uncharacterized protein n=1 Tax=Lactarius akahatsu TaxID=416441 RepID=A0AAD4L7I7_9AGAM|nr:hypothetical protein EDB92DRAFT_1820656 [Lactarius akahatsu]